MAESRYAPIEGEAATLVLGLWKCSHFVLGLPNLLLAIDPKPLVSLFGTTSLEHIPNPRLFRLKTNPLDTGFFHVMFPERKTLFLTLSQDVLTILPSCVTMTRQ